MVLLSKFLGKNTDHVTVKSENLSAIPQAMWDTWGLRDNAKRGGRGPSCAPALLSLLSLENTSQWSINTGNVKREVDRVEQDLPINSLFQTNDALPTSLLAFYGIFSVF